MGGVCGRSCRIARRWLSFVVLAVVGLEMARLLNIGSASCLKRIRIIRTVVVGDIVRFCRK